MDKLWKKRYLANWTLVACTTKDGIAFTELDEPASSSYDHNLISRQASYFALLYRIKVVEERPSYGHGTGKSLLWALHLVLFKIFPATQRTVMYRVSRSYFREPYQHLAEGAGHRFSPYRHHFAFHLKLPQSIQYE